MFIDKKESETNEKFLKKGYLISDISNTDLLNIVHDFFINHVKDDLTETSKEKTNLDILNNFHNYLPIKELNNLEEVLDKISIITEYSILEHDKEKTIFKIAYLGNPKRLSQEFLDLDYELIDMQGSWAIKKK